MILAILQYVLDVRRRRYGQLYKLCSEMFHVSRARYRVLAKIFFKASWHVKDDAAIFRVY
jgi:hypothetical protein